MKKAWELERELRITAIPLDRRTHDSNWYDSDFQIPYGDNLIRLFWDSKVPGSGAPEIPYLSMVQAMGNRGFDVSAAEALLPQGIDLFNAGKIDDLRVLTAQILAALNQAPVDPTNPIHQFEHPSTWEQIVTSMGNVTKDNLLEEKTDLGAKIYQGWLGQLAGGSFGTAIEGYTGEQIHKVYGEIHDYITTPETTNDDVVYELILLDVFERLGCNLTAKDLGLEWVRQIQFGWSAEWVALRNLNQGILPPQSGSFNNPFAHWIGAQMRGMICGMLAPGWPLEAARLAYLDGIVSHEHNGVYGEIYAAVLTALAFVRQEVRTILKEAAAYLPQRSEYAAVVRYCLNRLKENDDPSAIWADFENKFKRYNWIHSYPNIAAVIYSLWFGNGDMTETFCLLAKAGLDVDCNAGLAGNVLGVIKPVPLQWATPIGDRLETYIKGKEVLSIQELAQKTANLAIRR
ncbi:MAG: ADP-ribosylglycohydrolase family protein [Chloroflexi bacterium HGW-Chloroflexi-3]|nr:MAG: ADP-ribosylglycohydrolase family protein [Chloroflexi bacterium HGW-Chloroflexi-3]